MAETQLTGRQIQMIVLVVVILLAGLMAYVFTVLPSERDREASRRTAIASAIIAGLACVWFAKLVIDAIGDKRRGIERGPAKVTGRFHLIFGAIVALCGIVCSALTFWSATAAGGGIWTLYYGMILWGLGQMFLGWRKLDDGRSESPTQILG